METKNCKHCGKIFFKNKNWSNPKWIKAQFCSCRCANIYRIPEYTGEKNGHWFGDEVSCDGIHKWVFKHKGQTDICEHCGKSGLTGHQIQWANIDHKYRRVLEDYIRLCAYCHTKYDKEHGLR